MADVEKKILISAESKIQPTIDDLLALNQQLDEQQTKQKILELQGKRNTAAYHEISSAVRLTKDSIRQTNKELDNANKAFKSANGSIAQNRALLSTLTAEYIRLEQTEGKTAKSTIQMGHNIAQLSEKLKAQEKQIGLTQRSVGNYHDSIISALSSLSGSLPGLEKFTGTMGTVTRVVGFLPSALAKAGTGITNFVGNPGRSIVQGFGMMQSSAGKATEQIEEVAPAAEEAGAKLGMMGILARGLSVGIAGLVVAGAALISYFKDIAPVADKVTVHWEGIKAAFQSVVKSIVDGDWANMRKNSNEAAAAVRELTQAMIDLNREMLVSDVESNKENEHIATQMLRLRNIHTTAEEAKKIFNDIQNTAETQYKRVSKEGEAGYNIMANHIAKVAHLTRDELTSLAHDGVTAAIKLKEAGKNITDDSIAQLARFENMRTAAEGIKDQVEQRAQNREEQRIAKAEAAAQKLQSELDEARRAGEQIDQERKNSAIRVLELTMDSYSKELSQTDQHFKDMLFKNQQFIEKTEALQRKAKSPKAKAAYQADIDKAIAAGKQFQTEWTDTIDKIVKENTEKMTDQVIAADLELKQLMNQSETDQVKQKIEAEKLKTQATLNSLDIQKHAIEDDQRDLEAQMKLASGKKLAELQKDYDHNLVLLQGYELKRKTITKQSEKEIADIERDAAQAALAARDQAAVIATGDNGSSQNHDAHYAALQKELDDEHDANLQRLIDKKITNDQFAALDEKYIADTNALHKQKAKDKRDFEIQMAQDVANTGFNIAKNALAGNAQAAEASLNRQKTFELNNQSLTATQKAVIEEKYRIKEGQAKVKLFKEEQKLGIAQAIVNGAIAITKATAQTGIGSAFVIPAIIAETAIEIGTIAAQKPPAYAKGGLHYESDGRGGVLPGYSKTDNTNAYLRSGEAVVVSEAMQNPYARSLVSSINQAFGGRPFDGSKSANNPWIKPGFASGGIYLPTAENGLRPTMPVSSRLHNDDMASIAGMIGAHVSNAMLNAPPSVIDVKDINHAQGVRSNTIARVTH